MAGSPGRPTAEHGCRFSDSREACGLCLCQQALLSAGVQAGRHRCRGGPIGPGGGAEMKRARNVPGIYRGVLLPAIGGKKWLSLAIWAFGVSLIWAVSALVLPAEAAFPHDHTVLTAELKKYVEGPLVHYRRWKEHPEGLNRYIALLSKMRVDEYAGLSEDEKKCLWINAYNALTIKIVLERYPIHGIKPYYPPDSLRQIPDVWEAYHFRVAGKEVNLYNIE